MRFYNPKPREYQSTYVDQKLPYDLLLKAGQVKQAKYDEGLGKVQGLKKEIKALPIDAQEALEKQNLIDTKIQEFTNSIPNQDYTDPTFQRRFLQAQNEVNKLYRESNKAYEQRISEAEQLKKEAAEEKDPNFRTFLENQYKELYNPQGDRGLAANYDPSSGVYNPVKKSVKFDYRKKPDIDKELNEVIGSIKADKDAWLSNNPQMLAEYQSSVSKGSNEFISNSKAFKGLLSKADDRDLIKSLIVQANPNLSASKLEELVDIEVQNNKTVTKDRRGNPVYGFNPQTLSGREFQSALDRIVYNKEDLDRNILTDPNAGDKRKEKIANLTTSTQSEGLTGSEIPDITKDLEFDKQGNLIGGTKEVPYTYVTQTGEEHTGTKRVPLTPADQLEKAKVIVKLQNEHPELKGLSPQKTVEAYRKAVTSLESESVPLRSVTGRASEDIGKSLARNKNQRNFYVYDGKGKTLDGQLSTVLKELNITEEKFDEQLAKGISGYTQAGPSAGSYYVEVKNDDGKTRRVMISPDEEMKKTFSASQKVNEARKTLTPQVITPYDNHPDIKILVKPLIKKDGSTQWDYMKVRVNEQGQAIESEPTTLEDIRKEEREALEESGYIGSQVGILPPHHTE